jgi:hypothetical protein
MSCALPRGYIVSDCFECPPTPDDVVDRVHRLDLKADWDLQYVVMAVLNETLTCNNLHRVSSVSTKQGRRAAMQRHSLDGVLIV